MVETFDVELLRVWLNATELTVDGLPTGGGWSNETVFVQADGRPLVVRLASSEASMFPVYDLEMQVRSLTYVRNGGVPVPGVVGSEDRTELLGRPFFVMDQLVGRVPADGNPPFTKAGFLFDASAPNQRMFWIGAVEAIARVHRLDAPHFATVGPTVASHLT